MHLHTLSPVPQCAPPGIQQSLLSLHKGRAKYLCSSREEAGQRGRTGSCCHWDICDLLRTDHTREQPLIHRLESPSSPNTLAAAVRRCWRVPILKLASTWSPETVSTLSPTAYLFPAGKRLGSLHKYKIQSLQINLSWFYLHPLISPANKWKVTWRNDSMPGNLTLSPPHSEYFNPICLPIFRSILPTPV